MNKQTYGFQCTMANGMIYAPAMFGFNRNEAAKRMREAKAIFTGCRDWRLTTIS